MKLTTLTILFSACLAQAATLTNVVVSGQFFSPIVIDNPLYRTYGDFRPVSNTGVITDPGGTQFYSSHFGALAAVQTGIDGPGVALLIDTNYRFSFTVLDPTNSGYSLTLDHSILGYLNAAFDIDNSPSGSSLGARYQGITVEWLDPGNTWVPIDNLELPTTFIARADEDEPELSRSFFDGAAATAFVLTGTRDFQFRFNFDLQAAAGPGAVGEAAVRLGLDPGNAIPSLVLSRTPGPDGTPSDQLGHFVTLRVDSFGGPIGNEVPEPATLLTTATALAIALRLKYRR
jgi:hypothetical protein